MVVDSLKAKYSAAIMIYKEDGAAQLYRVIQNVVTNQLRYSLVFQFLKWLRYGKVIVPSRNSYVVVDVLRQSKFYIPDITHVSKATVAHEEDNAEGYFSDEFFTAIEPGDTVLEVGGFIGVTTKIAARRADEVYVLEPVSDNRYCLEKNIEGHDNVTVLPYAAGEEERSETINIGRNRAKSSLLSLDWEKSPDRDTVKKETIEIKRLDDICDEIGVEKIDFLKLEGEGFEPEILNGIGDVEVAKMVVNCSDDRGGESPKSEVISQLESKGYETYVKRELMVYAKKR